MLKLIAVYLLFVLSCLIVFAAVYALGGAFVRWFAHLAGVSQIVVFGMAGSSLWLLAAGITNGLVNLARKLGIAETLILSLLFGLLLLLFGLLLFAIRVADEDLTASRLLTFLGSLIMISELALYPLFILPAQLKKTSPQE